MATTELERTTGGGAAGDGAHPSAPSAAPRARGRGRLAMAGAVGRFMALSFLAVMLLGLGGLWVQQHLAEEDAVRNAQEKAEIFGRDIAAPLLTDALLDREPVAYARFDAVVRRLVERGNAARVKVWTPEGRVVYSDDARLVGRVFPLDEEDQEVLRTGATEAEVSDLTAQENLFEGAYDRLLEVYLPVTNPSGRVLLFEAYFPFDEVAADGSRVWWRFAPVLIGAVLLLWCTQVPLAWSMARRVRTAQREREQLMRDRIAAAERERRRIASDLHDGVVQDLAGAAMSLAAARNGVRHHPAERTEDALDEGVDTIHEAMRELRDMIVAISPPPMSARGMEGALHDLRARLAEDDVAATIQVALAGPLPPDVAQVLYRCALEATRNVLRHAAAGRVAFLLTSDGERAMLAVSDDGRGFGPSDRERARGAGHVGLDLLSTLAADGGGTLVIDSAPGRGTRVEVTVPCR